MSYTQALLIQRVRDLTLDSPWAVNFVGNINNSTTTVPVPDGTRWEEGRILEFQDTGEQCWVVSVAANNLTVIRGFNGTAKAAHDGSVTAIPAFQNPVFTFKRIVDEAEKILLSYMWPHVYVKRNVTVVPLNTKVWYDLAADAMALIRAVQVSASGVIQIYKYGVKNSGRPIAFQTSVPASLAASGTAVGFPRGFATTLTNVVVDYASKLTLVGTPTYTDFSDGPIADAIAYGAAARLMMGTESSRVTQDDINMGDSSVVPGSRSRQGSGLWGLFLATRAQAHEELARTQPLMESAGNG